MRNSLLAVALLSAAGTVAALGTTPAPSPDTPIINPCSAATAKNLTPTYLRADDGTITLTSSLGNTIVLTPTQSSIANIGPGALGLDMRAFYERGYTINGYSVKIIAAPTKQLPHGRGVTTQQMHPECGGGDGGYSESWSFGDYNPGGFGDSYFSSNDGSGALGDPYHVDVIGYRDPIAINNGAAGFNISYNPPSEGTRSGGGGGPPSTQQERRDSCRSVANQMAFIGAVGCGIMAMRNTPGAIACGVVFGIAYTGVTVRCDNLP